MNGTAMEQSSWTFRATSKLTRRIRHGQRTQSPKEPMARNDLAEVVQRVALGVTENGIGLSRRGRCPRLRQALDCLRPSKVHPEWIRRAFQSLGAISSCEEVAQFNLGGL